MQEKIEKIVHYFLILGYDGTNPTILSPSGLKPISARLSLLLWFPLEESFNGIHSASFTSKQSFFLCVIAPQFSHAPFLNLVAAFPWKGIGMIKHCLEHQQNIRT